MIGVVRRRRRHAICVYGRGKRLKGPGGGREGEWEYDRGCGDADIDAECVYGIGGWWWGLMRRLNEEAQ